jgi:integrase
VVKRRDLASGVTRVERSYHPQTGTYGPPKSKEGRRGVPIAAGLGDVLVEHRMNGTGEGLVFGRARGLPFSNGSVIKRARRFWSVDSDMEPTGLHECRHMCASALIAAGVNAKVLSVYTGHANFSTTYDLYGHLMPSGEADAVLLIDAYYERETAPGTATRTSEAA